MPSRSGLPRESPKLHLESVIAGSESESETMRLGPISRQLRRLLTSNHDHGETLVSDQLRFAHKSQTLSTSGPRLGVLSTPLSPGSSLDRELSSTASPMTEVAPAAPRDSLASDSSQAHDLVSGSLYSPPQQLSLTPRRRPCACIARCLFSSPSSSRSHTTILSYQPPTMPGTPTPSSSRACTRRSTTSGPTCGPTWPSSRRSSSSSSTTTTPSSSRSARVSRVKGGGSRE